MRRLIVVVFLLLSCAGASADMCFPPKAGQEHVYLSENGAWRLVLRRPDRASLYRKGAWRRHARWTLINSPDNVRVANDGTVITNGIACATGIHHAAVIYRPDGSLVRQIELADLLYDEDIAAIPRSVSFIQWQGEHRIDLEKRQLILQVQGPPRTIELPISLDTGELLVPKVRRFHVPRFSPVVSYGVAEGVAAKCEGGIAIGSAELLALATEPVSAVYPVVAVKARISGQVVVELTVKEDGTVGGVAVITPVPFGIDQAAVSAAQKWKFRASETRVCGRIAFHFGIIEE